MQRCNITHIFECANTAVMDGLIKLTYCTFHNLGLDMQGSISYKSFPITQDLSYQNVSLVYSCPVDMLDAVKSLWGMTDFDSIEYVR